MENFVRNLPPGSSELRYIRVSAAHPSAFKLSFGQKSGLTTLMNSIIARLAEIPLPAVERTTENEAVDVSEATNSQSQTHRHRRNMPEIDLLNIQQTLNGKLKQALNKHNLLHDDFPIIRSDTRKLPFKFWIKCPHCPKDKVVTISLDKRSPMNQYFNFRIYNFTKHIVKCMKT